jgi:hypothetical protein
MARIPVGRVAHIERRDDEHERRGGIPLWAWPLIPLLLGALALGLSLRGNDNGSAQTNRQPAAAGNVNNNNAGNTTNNAGQNSAANGNQAADGQGLTDMLVVVNDENQAALAGRPALFANVRVQSVVGDRGFWIGPDQTQQLFVVMDEANVGQSEGQIQVQPGQTLTLNGVIEKLPPIGQAPAEWGLDASNGEALANQQVYLHANQVVAGQ